LQPAQRQRRTELLTLHGRIHTDDVDLTDRLVMMLVLMRRLVIVVVRHRTVHLRPVETDESPVLLREEEPLRVEPWLLLTHVHVVKRPAALVRMFDERA